MESRPRILRDLAQAGLIAVSKRGNRNAYVVNEDASCPHPSIPALRLGNLVAAVRREGETLKRTYENASTKLAAFLVAPVSMGDAETLAVLVPVFL
jgi:hypothetical protein